MYLSFIYILLIVAGLAWIIYRVRAYTRTERQREQDLGVLFTDDQFKKSLDLLKKRNAAKAGPDITPETDKTPRDS